MLENAVSPPGRKPLPQVRKPYLHSDHGQDSNLCTWRPFVPQSMHGSTVPWKITAFDMGLVGHLTARNKFLGLIAEAVQCRACLLRPFPGPLGQKERDPEDPTQEYFGRDVASLRVVEVLGLVEEAEVHESRSTNSVPGAGCARAKVLIAAAFKGMDSLLKFVLIKNEELEWGLMPLTALRSQWWPVLFLQAKKCRVRPWRRDPAIAPIKEKITSEETAVRVHQVGPGRCHKSKDRGNMAAMKLGARVSLSTLTQKAVGFLCHREVM
ncbi:hypothetical protein E2C01_035997 [Portunus trituberculatus]|uniref:Uncharacterized protein n=1 Tax=Portunus trituberculatus TaxID=210409 RepID=A0A5B7F9W4_PORTR|nr:hypothetical protein [Portunus trituberculatus]